MWCHLILISLLLLFCFVGLFSLRQGRTKMALNSGSSCFSFTSAGITNVRHRPHLLPHFKVKETESQNNIQTPRARDLQGVRLILNLVSCESSGLVPPIWSSTSSKGSWVPAELIRPKTWERLPCKVGAESLPATPCGWLKVMPQGFPRGPQTF